MTSLGSVRRTAPVSSLGGTGSRDDPLHTGGDLTASGTMQTCPTQVSVAAVHNCLKRALWDVAPNNLQETLPALRRRQVTTAIVIALGAIVLGVSMSIEAGSAWFYPATMGLALLWTVGGLASGPLHLGRIAGTDRLRRPIVAPVVIGLGLGAFFVLGALIVRKVPFLEGQVSTVVEHADQGSGLLLVFITVVNGIAEEVFFRGAAYASVRRHPVLVTTAAYALATFATGNVMLAFAAVLLGIVVGLERRASGGILAPALTHVTWSLTMLFALPLMFS